MRIIGAPDYYDGTAYSRRDGVASLLVYRREDARVPDVSMRRAFGIARTAFRGGVTGADGSVPKGRLSRRFGLDDWLSWGSFHIRIDTCHVLFCGTMHRGLVITAATGRTPDACAGRIRYCWSVDAYEEGLAENGLTAADDHHLNWFTAMDRTSAARLFGITTASCDPMDAQGGWRTDAPSLGGMGFDAPMPAHTALSTLASWIGEGEARIMTRHADSPRSMIDSASGGR